MLFTSSEQSRCCQIAKAALAALLISTTLSQAQAAEPADQSTAAGIQLSFQAHETGTVTGDFMITGFAPEGVSELKLVVDGGLYKALPVEVDSRGYWQTMVPVNNFPPGQSMHELVALEPASGMTSLPLMVISRL